MFEARSRYAKLETAVHTLADGREVVYARRRMLPPYGRGALLAEARTSEGDRLDLVTTRYLGDPEQYWRICDANDVLRPADLTAEPNAVIRVAIPEI